MTYIKLITPNYLKSFNPAINNNVDDRMILHSIDKMQKMKMTDIIGQVFMNDLMNTISVSGETGLSEANQTIMNDYFKPILASYTYIDMLIPLSYQVDNSGVREKIVTDSNATSKSTINYLQENTKHEIEYYKNQLDWFLNENSDLYPLYYECENNTPKAVDKTNSGFFFPKK